MVDPTANLAAVENILNALAHKYKDQYPITFEEAKTEAYYAYVRACYDFKPDAGMKFSSWVYTWVWQHLKTLIMKRSADPLAFIEINDETTPCEAGVGSMSLQMILDDTAADLSSDAVTILKLIVETPGDVIGEMSVTPKQLLSRVKAMLADAWGDRRRVDDAHKEICLRFAEAWA